MAAKQADPAEEIIGRVGLRGGMVQKRPWITSLSFVLVFAVFIATILRPPGVMPGYADGDITYVLCTGDGVRTITISVDGSKHTPEQAHQGCEFFTSETAIFLNHSATPVPHLVADGIRRAQFIAKLWARQPAQIANAPRAPPLEIELS